jgi:transcriptional regulator with XRE-family HTH domain
MPISRTVSPDAIAFGAILRRLRLEKHWTYQELARASGMHPTYLRILETGGNEPKISTLILLAGIFGVDPRSIFGEMIERRGAAGKG